MFLLLTHAALAAPPALPTRLSEEPAVGGELTGPVASLPLVEQRLEVEVGITEALLTLTQRFEVSVDGPATYSFPTPEGAWLLEAQLIEVTAKSL